MSFWASTAACPGGGFQHTPACPELTSPPALCSVSAAVGNANSASRLARTGLLRPRMVSKRPTRWRSRSDGGLAGLAELTLQRVQLGQTLLERRVRPEEVAEAEAPTAALGGPVRHGRGEEEGVEGLGGPEVLRRDAPHLSGDLDQRRGEQGGPADEQRARPIGGQLPVAGERHGEEEAHEVDDDRHQQHEHLYQRGLALLVVAAAPAA